MTSQALLSDFLSRKLSDGPKNSRIRVNRVRAVGVKVRCLAKGQVKKKLFSLLLNIESFLLLFF